MPRTVIEVSGRPMNIAGKRDLTNEERELFRHAVSDVRPLKPTETVTVRPPRPKLSAMAHSSWSAGEVCFLRDPSLAELDYTDELSYKKIGVSPAIFRKLKRGQFPCQDVVDLHGLPLTKAKSLLINFLNACRARGLRCVLIVHGKGYRSPDQKPVLKPRVAHWLAQRDDVVAYVSARTAEGGTGALYALLKSSAGG
ncbi:MAG: Smr/MutS family protein [Gammaproteobacteria bacterium]